MTLLIQIGLQAVEIMTLIVGILGMTLSLMLMFAPSKAQSLSSKLNRSVDVEEKISFLDKNIPTENLIYSHAKAAGSILAAGSAFAFIFFALRFDTAHFAKIFFGSQNHTLSGEIIFQTMAWIGRAACVLGLLAAGALLFAPQKLRALEKCLNAWVETRGFVQRINRSSTSLDTVLFRFPVLFGLLGGSISSLLIVLSILNLLR